MQPFTLCISHDISRLRPTESFDILQEIFHISEIQFTNVNYPPFFVSPMRARNKAER